MKDKSFKFTTTFTSGSLVVVVLVAAMLAIDSGAKQAHATSSFGQNRSAANQNKKIEKQDDLLLPREPSIGLPTRTRGGIDASANRLSKAEADYRAGRSAAAVPELKEAIKENPNSHESHYLLALSLTETGKLKEAIEEFKRVIELADKNDPKVLSYYNMGNAYADLGEHDQAIESYKQAIKLNPTLSKPHYNLGLAYAASRRTSDAAAEFAEAVKLRPDYAQAHYNLGVAYLQLGKKQEAEEQSRKLGTLKPELATKLQALIDRESD